MCVRVVVLPRQTVRGTRHHHHQLFQSSPVRLWRRKIGFTFTYRTVTRTAKKAPKAPTASQAVLQRTRFNPRMYISVLVLSWLAGVSAVAGKVFGLGRFLGRRKEVKGEDQEASLLLPQLPPHKDDCYLVEFHSDNCDHCEQMEPVLQRLERDLATKVRRINIFRRREFYSLLEAMGHDECGGLPFYYNRRTGQAICGATSYANLRRWGTGSVKHLFQDPPEAREPEMDMKNRRDVGAKQMLMEKMQKWNVRTPTKKDGGKGKQSSRGGKRTGGAQKTEVNRGSSNRTKGGLGGGKEKAVGGGSGSTAERKLSPSERLAARRASRDKKLQDK